MVPITRSAKGFCHGECGVVRTSARPMAFTRCRNCPPKIPSRSRMRNRGAESCGKASTTCCGVQAAGRGVGHFEMYDSAAVMEEDYEHVEHAERRCGHDDEVDRDKIGDVIFEEGPPGLRGRFRTARHEPTNRAL